MNIFKNLFKKSYIEYDNKNSMWNNGHVHVYVKDELVESIFVDEDNPYDIIDRMKDKYSISKVITKEHNWR